MKKRLISLMLSATVITSVGFCNNPGLAKVDSKHVHGKIRSHFTFKKSETTDAINWIQSTKTLGEDFISKDIAKSTDADKIKFLNQVLAESKKINVKNLFKINKDGSSSMEMKIPHCKVVMDGTTTTTSDENGTYSFDNPTVGKHKIDVYYNDTLIKSDNVDISEQNIDRRGTSDASKDVDLTLSASSSQINDAINKMGESMVNSQSIYLPSYFGISSSSFGTYNTSTRKYPYFQPVQTKSGTYYNMYFITPSGHVGCNKADTTLASAQTFPKDVGSDCAKSIAFGALAYSSPVLALYYYNSEYCAIETAQEAYSKMGGGNETNVYCNGKRGSDGHYNCSWFNGIGCDERLHTHDGSSSVKQ
ncbi:MAG TPA: hypothetical protein VF941_08640 [Clostridia bacterium]